jgi:hypothetical protein
VTTRPTVPTARVAHALCDLVREGLPPGAAAKALGLSDQTLRTLLWVGRHGGPQRFVTFAQWVEDAKREREQTVAELVEVAREHAWR